MRSLILFCLLLPLLTGCRIADLGTTATDDAKRARALLQRAHDAMGYDQMASVATYGVTANFDWAPVWGMMPMNSLPGAKGHDVRFRFAAHTFDGQIEFLEGPRVGHTYGLQSWETYRQDDPQGAAEVTDSKRYSWGLATYHYLIEAPRRLLEADVIRYAGTTEFNGRTYDLVFATWGDGNNRKEYDQWLLYLNQETGFLDLTEITITDFFLPMPNNMKRGTVHFPQRERTTVGTWLPTTMVIQLGRPKENIERDVYTIRYRDFTFDDFPTDRLYPLPGRRKYGDSKPTRK